MERLIPQSFSPYQSKHSLSSRVRCWLAIRSCMLSYECIFSRTRWNFLLRVSASSSHRHPERSAAKSKDPVAKPQRNVAGFDSLTSRSLSLRPSRPCHGFPSRSILDFARNDEQLLWLRDDSKIRLRRFPALGVPFLRFFVRHGARHDNVLSRQ